MMTTMRPKFSSLSIRFIRSNISCRNLETMRRKISWQTPLQIWMRTKVSCLLLALTVSTAYAGTIVVLQNQDATVSINEELGSIIQLPSAVSTVTASKYFHITDVGSNFDPASGSKVDVRSFQIKPSANSGSENVTFVLANGKSIAFKFIPAKDGDKFYDVRFDQLKKISKTFLAQEMHMLKSMIVNDGDGYIRDVANENIETEVNDLRFKLIRMYGSDHLTGYVFEVTNEGEQKHKINLSEISFGFPNQAIMAHVDREELDVCPLLNTKPDCMTRLHVVTRGTARNPNLILPSQPPFIKSDALNEGDL